MPGKGKGNGGDIDDFEIMPTLKMVMDYSGLNIHQALELPCDMYRLVVKNATIEKLQQTEEGRKYLADCERMKKTTPDFKAIRNKMNE